MKSCILVMGICGTGKTTVGQLLSEKLDVLFIEGDDFHPKENVDKMKSGSPLNDKDRQSWLEQLAEELKKNEQSGCVLACSALKEKYRETLRSTLSKKLFIVHLVGGPKMIEERMMKRKNHFMPSNMIASQLADLEKPNEALEIDIAIAPSEMIKMVLDALSI